MTIVYSVQNLVKFYSGQTRPANDNVSFEVQQGEIFGVLGDNGGGKSTLVKQMGGPLRSTAGQIKLYGKSGREKRERIGLFVGYMPQQSDALNRLTVGEAFYFTAHLRGLDKIRSAIERDTLLEQLGLQDLRDRDNALLSGGQRRLLRLGVAMAGSPPILLLDEPTNDLDPLRRRIVWDLLRDLNFKNGVTIIFITHDAIEAEKVIKRIAIMHEGRLVGIGKPSDLKKQLGNDLRVELRFLPENAPVVQPGFRFEVRRPDHWVFLADRSDTVKLLNSLNLDQLESVRIASPTLEDLYLHYVTE